MWGEGLGRNALSPLLIPRPWGGGQEEPERLSMVTPEAHIMPPVPSGVEAGGGGLGGEIRSRTNVGCRARNFDRRLLSA